MKHSGKARQSAVRLILVALILLAVVLVMGVVAAVFATFIAVIAAVLVALWVGFALFTLYFFRDPNPQVPTGAGLVVSPAHGTVDLIGPATEPEFMGGECQRVSIFLSVFNVHVQNAPVGGRVAFYKFSEGQFLNAINADCALHNENLLLGFEAADPPDTRIGMRLIAGLIARRIVPWVTLGEAVLRGERVSLIQFGSRVNLYLPKHAQIKVQLGDKVRGGETVLAQFS